MGGEVPSHKGAWRGPRPGRLRCLGAKKGNRPMSARQKGKNPVTLATQEKACDQSAMGQGGGQRINPSSIISGE